MNVQTSFKVAPSVLLTNHHVLKTDCIAATSLEEVPSSPVLPDVRRESELVSSRQ